MIRPYQKQDHDRFAELLIAHNWPVLEEVLLPPTGFVSMINNTPSAFVFVYQNIGCCWCVMEWLVVDKNLSKSDRNEAIEECIKSACDFANSNNLVLFTSCKGAK